MAPKGSCKGNGKAPGRVEMPTLVINQHLSLDCDHMKGFISAHLSGDIWFYNVYSVMDTWVWDISYDIIFLAPVTTPHITQFRLIRPHRRTRSSHFGELWAAFSSYMVQMFDKTCH
jgi:hypothetical protein